MAADVEWIIQQNDDQWSVNNFYLCILRNLCSNWLQTSIYEILAAFGPKNNSNMYCEQQVWIPQQRSGFWPTVWFGLVPDPAKNPTRFVLVGLLPGPDINPLFFCRVGTGPRLHITVPTMLAVLWLHLSFWVLIKS
jgi:hypothetical protein